jgi:glyoxylase-like metal-dependent hydrolase (beta-lactamase superfamily II)
VIWSVIQNPRLGCNSFLVGDEVSGQGAVVDPLGQVGIEAYVLEAHSLGMQIVEVLETHVHADHVSLAKDLARELSVPYRISRHAPIISMTEAHRLAEGMRLEYGALALDVWETPGHTPDSLALVIRDLARGEAPWAVLTGDSLFVGDVGRPDLVDADEAAIKQATINQYHSIRRLMELPDWTELWPAHYGSSPCGGIFMNRRPQSTIGYERQFNPFIKLTDEETFVKETLRFLKPPPQDAKEIRATNLSA